MHSHIDIPKLVSYDQTQETMEGLKRDLKGGFHLKRCGFRECVTHHPSFFESKVGVDHQSRVVFVSLLH